CRALRVPRLGDAGLDQRARLGRPPLHVCPPAARPRPGGEHRRHQGALRAADPEDGGSGGRIMIHPFVGTAATVLLALLAVPFGLAAYRMIAGPGYADRFVALDMLTSIAVVGSALTALATGRAEYLDIALVIALINFVA